MIMLSCNAISRMQSTLQFNNIALLMAYPILSYVACITINEDILVKQHRFFVETFIGVDALSGKTEWFNVDVGHRSSLGCLADAGAFACFGYSAIFTADVGSGEANESSEDGEEDLGSTFHVCSVRSSFSKTI